MFWVDGPVVVFGGRGAIGVGLDWVVSAGNSRIFPCSSHSYCKFDDPPVWVIMRIILVVSDTHDLLERGVACISSGNDGGLCVFVPSVIQSSTLYQHAGIPLHRASNSSRVQGGWVPLLLVRLLIPVHSVLVLRFTSGSSNWAL